MFRCVALLRKRHDLSREQFIDYYEQKHSKLILSLLPGILNYTRKYVEIDGAYLYPAISHLDLDVVTELTFADRASYEKFAQKAGETDIAKLIAEDEQHLFDRDFTRMFIVDEFSSVTETAPKALPPSMHCD
jgi:hypothetical protein